MLGIGGDHRDYCNLSLYTAAQGACLEIPASAHPRVYLLYSCLPTHLRLTVEEVEEVGQKAIYFVNSASISYFDFWSQRECKIRELQERLHMFAVSVCASLALALATKLEKGGQPNNANQQVSYGLSPVNLMKNDKVVSYSGFYSVESRITETTSKMFGWFFPSQTGQMNDPVILQLSGLPGSMDVFWENGPYTINSDGQLKQNEYSWNTNVSMLYVDQPFGMGYTPRLSLKVAEVNEKEVSDYLYQFLRSFYNQFPQYKYAPFYIHGQDMAGHYAPVLAAYILEQNDLYPAKTIRLTGLFLGNAWVNPLVQNDHEPYAVEQGLLEEETFATQHIKKLYQRCYESLALEIYAEAERVCGMIIPGIQLAADKLETPTGLLYMVSHHNVQEPCYMGGDLECYNQTYISKFLSMASTMQALNIGNGEWRGVDPLALVQLQVDQMRNFAQTLSLVLANDVRVLVYNGMLDLQADWMSTQKMVEGIYWPYQRAFNSIDLQKWNANARGSGALGLIKSYGGLTFLAVKDAGHFVSHDQPSIGRSIMYAFTSDSLPESTASSYSSSSGKTQLKSSNKVLATTKKTLKLSSGGQRLPNAPLWPAW
eukprot:g24500.t1